MANDSGGNPQVDFVWGNMPMQPDTQRVVTPTPDAFGAVESAKLTAALDNHTTATQNYSGFPWFVPNKGVPSVAIPNVVGALTLAAATTTINGVGMVVGKVTETTVGALVGNNGNVKAQDPPAAQLWFTGAPVDLVLYKYVA